MQSIVLFMWYHDDIHEKGRYYEHQYEVPHRGCAKVYHDAMGYYGIRYFRGFFAILTVQAIIEQHDAAIGFLALLFIPILAIIPLIIMYQESASVDIDALNEFSGVTITEVKDENGYSNAGKSLDKSIDDRNGYATTSVHYIKDGKMYTDGVIIIHQGRAGLFSNGSNSLQPVLADK